LFPHFHDVSVSYYIKRVVAAAIVFTVSLSSLPFNHKKCIVSLGVPAASPLTKIRLAVC
jgi:hypothetical protein